jgi:hypothetical protein
MKKYNLIKKNLTSFEAVHNSRKNIKTLTKYPSQCNSCDINTMQLQLLL